MDEVVLDPDGWILARSKNVGPFAEGPPKVVAIDPTPGVGGACRGAVDDRRHLS